MAVAGLSFRAFDIFAIFRLSAQLTT